MSRLTKLRVGLVGCGAFGASHAAAFSGIPFTEVVAVADTRVERAQELAARYGIRRVCRNAEELCALPEVEAVSVVTTEDQHLAPVLTAIDHGKPVLVEKPLATRLGDAVKMVETARQADVILMPGHILRFETRYALVKEKLDGGELGRVVSIQTRRNRSKEAHQKYARAHPFLVTAIHDLDLLLWYSSSTAHRVRGYQRNVMGGPNPELAWGIIEFANGVIGFIESTWLTPERAGIYSNDRLHLIGTRGVADLDLVDGGLSFWLDEGYSVPDVSYEPRIHGAVGGALAAELAYFAACIVKGEAPRVVTAEESLAGIRVANALLESAEKETDVFLG